MADIKKGDPIDASVSIKTDDGYTAAYLTVIPAKNGGKDITMDTIKKNLAVLGIRFGIDEEKLNEMLEKKLYDTSICVAKWQPPVDGENGDITYHFNCNSNLVPKEDENGIVDYKDLGLIQNIKEGTIIAEIVHPTEGTAGTDIRGLPMLPVPGKKSNYAIGKGCRLEEDDTKLVAAIDGNIRWNKDRFVVDDVVVVSGDIDSSTGNIDFIGNVVVKGEVRDNFTIISQKNILVNGNVNGAHLIAEGDVEIKMGSINSTIDANGSVKCGFCENSKIKCKGALVSSSFVACNIFCEGEITAVTGKGVIVGGTVTALQNITANTVGSETYTKTAIILGNYAQLTEEKISVQKHLDSLKEQMKKLIRIVDILNNEKKQNGSLIPEREEMLTSSMKMKFATQGEYKRATIKMTQLDAELSESKDLTLTCKRDLWPGVQLRIHNEKISVDNRQIRCEARFDDSHTIIFAPMRG